MKKLNYLLILLAVISMSSCSSDDDSNNDNNNEAYSIEYIFEGSYGSTGLLTFSSFSDNALIEVENYENFPEDEFTISEEFIVNSSDIISARVTINDMNMVFRGNATMRIIDPNNEVVALIKEEYLNTDAPQITCFLTLSYNPETGESDLEFN